MGSRITELMETTALNLESLRDKVLVVDTFNQIYMFLTTIRQRDGSLLMDSHNNITSHLSGLFNRFTKLMENDIKFVFVFDGKAPELKNKEREHRKEIKIDAKKKYEEAKKEKDMERMKKYASRTSIITNDIIKSSKELITALGFPVVQAPSEGEAQAAYMVKKGDAYAVLSQDADSLMFGAPKIIKNLTITKKRKQSNKLVYETIQPELISLDKNLNKMGIDQDQLIFMGILMGTDYNRGGIKGIGPKKALKLIKDKGKDFDGIFNEIKDNWDFDFGWEKIFGLIKNMGVVVDYNIEFKGIDEEAVVDLMVKKHDFSEERIRKRLKDLQKNKPKEESLNKFF
ncbi:flap endonuclease-1 [Candidatus Woesearchaeota archaeon]|nr:flap endonuclease-1 [Candidatus Woesearchaeota archaeon]